MRIIEDICVNYDVFYKELNEFTKRNLENVDLSEIEHNALKIAQKFNLDINDYIESKINPEDVSIFSLQ